jgi:hypothetical protein
LTADVSLSALVQDCDVLLEEIRHAQDTSLYEEIEAHLDDMHIEPTSVYHGVMWYAQAAIADPRDGEKARHSFQKAVDSGFSPAFVLSKQVTGATILRLYVALVYLRGDWIRQCIGRATLDSAPSLLRYARLLSHKIVKHLRNSLALGHIALNCTGLHLKDRDFEVVLTPGMLNKICTGIWLLHRSILTVYARREGIIGLPGAFSDLAEKDRSGDEQQSSPNPNPDMIRAYADLHRAWSMHAKHVGLLEQIAKSGRISAADHEQKLAMAAISFVVAELKFRFAERPCQEVGSTGD